MASNLPPTQKENWTANEVVKPEHTNSWGRAINTLSKAVPLYSACGNVYTATYTNNVYNLTPLSFNDNTSNVTVDSYVDGMSVIFQCPTSNLANCSVNVNSLGAKTIKTIDNVNLPAGKLNSGVFVELKYDKTNGCFKFQQDFNKADRNFSNLTEEAEKHFLNKSQITNCLLEVPRRIKYTLVDGVLTILKGSVCIVPYGTEDKTADLPKGATFINENFKVYDTQFSDGKFFVWAELQKDFSNSWKGGNGIYLDFLKTGLDKDVDFAVQSGEVDNCFSGSTAPTGKEFMFWLDTQNNIIKRSENSGATWIDNECIALPYCINVKNTTGTVSVDQVFNGMGYISSTIWVDKGVKGLIPNGRNADGSLINEEVITDKLNIITIGNYTEPSAALGYLTEKLWDNQLDYVPTAIIYEQNAKPSIASNYRWYDTINGKWYIKDTGATVSKYSPWLKLADMSYANGKITSFAPKLPFRAADYNDIDGRWVSQSVEIINGETAFPLGSKKYRDYDISNYLPNDGHIYELAVEIIAFSGSSTNATSHWWVSDILGTYGAYQTCSCGGRAYSNARDEQYAIGRIPMAGRTLRLWCSSAGTAPTIRMLKLSGYRKVR